MTNHTDTKQSLKTAIRKTMLTALFIAAFLILMTGALNSFAADPEPLLTVRVDGKAVKVYEEIEELESIPGAIETDLTYSGYNSYPTLEMVHIDKAVRVDSIISDATGADVSSYDADNTIRFTGYDGYSSIFTVEQLFGTERYYYPKAGDGTDTKGGRAEKSAYEGRISVPAVIILDKANGANSKETFTFGQAAPNEQNTPECVKYMLTDGYIDISTGSTDKCKPVSTVEPSAGSIIPSDTEIHFLPLPDNEKDSRNKAYYIVDPEAGEVPGYGDNFYFYSPFKWTKKLINPPVLSEPGMHTVIIKVFAYGKQDSDLMIYRYFVGSENNSGLNATAVSYDSIRLAWKKQTGASGYVLYRKAGNGKEVLYKTLGPETTSFTDSGLDTGTLYSYRINLAATDKDGTTVEFPLSGAASAATSLGIPTIRIKAGKRKAMVRWDNVAGATGYEIYRSKKKSSGFKRVKTINKAGTKSFVNKKLKKKKKYYYKIRAFRTVNGMKIYSGYSVVKKCKVK